MSRPDIYRANPWLDDLEIVTTKSQARRVWTLLSSEIQRNFAEKSETEKEDVAAAIFRKVMEIDQTSDHELLDNVRIQLAPEISQSCLFHEFILVKKWHEFRDVADPKWVEKFKEYYGIHIPEFPSYEESKYEQPPSPEVANYLVFSMVVNLEEMRSVLSHFPSQGDKISPEGNYGDYQQGRATTLAWSGSSGNNVRISPWMGYQIGFVIDPNKVDVPYADFRADGSMDAVLATEYLTSRDEEIVDSSTTKVHKEDIQIKEDSKYRGKEKVLRPWLKRPQDRLITNQATINKVPG